MCLELPNDPSPDWDAPLLKPICRFRWPSEALNWSSVNSLLLTSAIFGPNLGPVYSGCFCVCKDKNTKRILKRETRVNRYNYPSSTTTLPPSMAYAAERAGRIPSLWAKIIVRENWRFSNIYRISRRIHV